MSRFDMKRRHFLQGLSAMGAATGGMAGLTALLSSASAAGPSLGYKDRYYVFVYFSGAWDILLGLDPRDPIQFADANISLTRVQPAYGMLDVAGNDGSPKYAPDGTMFGPFIGDLLNHYDKMSVIRGMSMETLTHEVGRRRFLTGKPPSGLQARGSSTATYFASLLGAEEAIPNLAVRVESYNTDQPNYATGLKTASVPDLLRALKKSDPTVEANLDQLIDAMLKEQAGCSTALASKTWQTGEASRAKARQMVSSGFDSLFDFQAKTDEMAALRAHYGIGASGTAALQSVGAQAATAATALKAGVSRVVSFQGASGLDTHFDEWQTDQGPRQEAGFNVVSRLIEDLASSEYKGTGASWLDHTVIVGFSEFSRTALINSRGGRDHSLTNACFVLGGGIKGGQAIGASTDVAMEPQAMSLTDGSVGDGEVVLPEHITMALLHDLGVDGDPFDLRVEPLKAILKTP